MLAARLMSSYDELVHEPMRPTLSSMGQSCFLAAAPKSLSVWARSGVKGPLMCGSSSSRLISITWSYSQPYNRIAEQERERERKEWMGGKGQRGKKKGKMEKVDRGDNGRDSKIRERGEERRKRGEKGEEK